MTHTKGIARMIHLTLAAPLSATHVIGSADMVLVHPDHVISVIGTSSHPSAGDTGSIVTLTGGLKYEVVQSARIVAGMLEEASHGQLGAEATEATESTMAKEFAFVAAEINRMRREGQRPACPEEKALISALERQWPDIRHNDLMVAVSEFFNGVIRVEQLVGQANDGGRKHGKVSRKRRAAA